MFYMDWRSDGRSRVVDPGVGLKSINLNGSLQSSSTVHVRERLHENVPVPLTLSNLMRQSHNQLPVVR